ncbi:beta-glucosidase [Verticillium alfalfae VaMs.102]|uniref:Beta-glucosidase cel3A n=1 Tax=Verticillium alfalfae (strain VaMs.102 / ATCC MYA-4576 / FGSC 10136) TaxID=526221 RepID=C9SCZ3_VERA1|nr:beta-glucosidase [Verticillium alfalfae VaMs.102]EEY16958.1 beta-glucosidase [Verticillium alfalfae VaMs.102]
MVNITRKLAVLGGIGVATALTDGGHFETVPTYPTPESIGTGWEAAFQKATDAVAKLNLTQKVALTTGATMGLSCNGNISPIEEIGFSGYCLADGPVSVRIADLATVFPAGLTAAATWDRDLIYQRGKALGAEFRGKGAQVHLGPASGALGRHPLGGRNWESFSVDPFLTGVAMDFSIRGIQEMGVQTSAKHFIGNEQETQRSNTFTEDGLEVAALSSNIDDRTMHELYLWPFADAVRAGVASVMCSYNRVNQTYVCENSKILNGLLKDELGFQGYVVSDWFATHSGVASAAAGLDMTMPGAMNSAATAIFPTPSYFGGNLTAAVLNGTLTEEKVNDMARRVLTPYFYLNQDEDFPSIDPSTGFVFARTYNYPDIYLTGAGMDPNNPPPARDVRANHADIVRKVAAAGTVLLKNTNNVLPLGKPKSVGVFGNGAADVTQGLTFTGDDSGPWGPNIGALSVGGGSGAGRHTRLISPLFALRGRIEDYGGRVQYLLDNHMMVEDDFTSIYPTPEVCFVFLKTWAREGTDRLSFENDWNSTVVVENVARRCNNTIVITHSGGVNTMPWADNENVTAILAAHYPGQENGYSISDVLFGDVNPSGRLPYTIPKKESDYDFPIVNITGDAARDSAAWQADFTEGQFIDYRHFDAKNITPQYEFGFGLSYTTFEMGSNATFERKCAGISPLPPQTNGTHPGGNPALWKEIGSVTVTVRNTGDVAGAQVVQLYMAFPQASVPEGTPVSVLRGFEKVSLQPGEAKSVTLPLRRRDVSFWNVVAQNWEIPSGDFEFRMGFSSRDIKTAVTSSFVV